MPEHYVRLYFMWHDRNNVANNLSLINESLIALGATDVKMQYTSDITVYGNDSLSKAQVNELRAKLPNLKVVQFNKIVFYDNVTYTEDEISEAVYNVTNGSVNVSFSPPMLEIVFSYTGNESALDDAVNAIQPAPLSKEIYRVANASTGNIVVNIKGKDYSVNSMYVTALVPHTASVDVPVSALFEVTIVGDEIVGAKPIVANKYTASG
jgi:predicted RND superfamily exporter protein